MAIAFSKRYRSFPIWLVFLLGLSGCVEHDEPVVNNGNPLFSVSGLANGNAFKFEGGVNDYYMFTRTQNIDHGLKGIEGQLAKEKCPNACGPSLTIRFRNYTLGNSFHTDSLLLPGSYSFYNLFNANNWVYELRTTQRSTGSGAPLFGWDFGNSYYSSDPSPVVLFPSEGIYNVSATCVYPTCFSTLTQPIFMTPNRVGKNTDFSVNHLDTQTLLFNSIPVISQASVTWDFGDGYTGTGAITQHHYSSRGIYKVCMQAIEGIDTIQFCQQVSTLDITDCMSNFHFTTSRKLDSMQYKSLVIEWRNASGQLYSSENIDQTGNTFKILSVTPYQLNAEQQPTYKLDITFSCKVSNGSQVIELKNVKGTFAVAVPSM